MSDTHNNIINDLPDGDILIHSGDITKFGELNELNHICEWMGELKYKYKIIIAGNHDKCLFENYDESIKIINNYNLIYLNNSGCVIEGYKIWGSPYIPQCGNWFFMANRDMLKNIYETIPIDIDILITHGPPYGKRDELYNGVNVGCDILLKYVKKIKPKIHIFGHIHNGYGVDNYGDTKYINASVVNDNLKLINEPILINI